MTIMTNKNDTDSVLITYVSKITNNSYCIMIYNIVMYRLGIKYNSNRNNSLVNSLIIPMFNCQLL